MGMATAWIVPLKTQWEHRGSHLVSLAASALSKCLTGCFAYTKRYCSVPVVRRTCLSPSYIKGSHAVPDVIMSFYPFKYTEMANLCVSCPSKEHSTYTTVTYLREIVFFSQRANSDLSFHLKYKIGMYSSMCVIHTSRISQSWTYLRKPEAFLSPNGFTTALVDKSFS